MKAQQTTITQKGQVTVPIEMRRALGLKARDKVLFELDEEEKVLKLRPATSVVTKWFGSVPATKQPKDDRALREAFEQGVADEVMQETS